MKPQHSLVHLDASSAVLPSDELVIEHGPLSFLNDPSFVHASSRSQHAISHENDCNSPILSPDEYGTTVNDNTFELHSRAAYSITESSSRDNYFDASYFEDVRDNTLPIEEDPDFVNVGCRLELGE